MLCNVKISLPLLQTFFPRINVKSHSIMTLKNWTTFGGSLGGSKDAVKDMRTYFFRKLLFKGKYFKRNVSDIVIDFTTSFSFNYIFKRIVFNQCQGLTFYYYYFCWKVLNCISKPNPVLLFQNSIKNDIFKKGICPLFPSCKFAINILWD